MKKIIISSLLLISATFSYAATEGRADFDNVVGLKIGTTGYIEIKLENDHGNPGGCTGNTKSIFIENDNLNKDKMLSIALYAKASSSQLTAWISGCTEDGGNKISNLEVN